jgi:subtilisin family serine protease
MTRRFVPRSAPVETSAAGAHAFVAVTFDARTALGMRTAVAARAAAVGATLTSRFTFARAGLETHVFAVAPARAAGVMAAFRALPGVQRVGITATRRYATAVTAPYFTDDPYFAGFASTNLGAPPTFEVEPLVESADVPGQWDMHVMRLEWAFAYSQAANGSGRSAPGALGSSSVKIAVIDTGEDTTHPELAGKIVYQRCFISNPENVQSTSDFTTDGDGHGTDVSGLAGAASNNGFGFTGAGGAAVLYGYRVFPTPDNNCLTPKSSDAQCGASTHDIAAAIEDAIGQHVNVISMSLGGGMCTDGDDPDPLEGSAVADAIAAGIIVVAAAGNGSGPPVVAPACDPGVLAVGATAIADGAPNGSGRSGGSSAAPFEYVASYTDYGSPGAAPRNPAAWGIVAPGGDPANDMDGDDLHWIENIWTSTPANANFAGSCNGDYPSETGTADCRVLIAGTSMSTPHVAGAAALILSVAPQYQSAAAMRALLCGTAADIGDPNEGCGRLDVYRAMATALSDPSVPASSPVP